MHVRVTVFHSRAQLPSGASRWRQTCHGLQRRKGERKTRVCGCRGEEKHVARRSLGSYGATPNRSVKRCQGELRGREAFIGQSLATAQPKFSAICCHMQMWVGGGRGGSESTRGREEHGSSYGRVAMQNGRAEMERHRRPLERSVAQCKAARNNGVICQDVGGGEHWQRGAGLISLLRYNAHATLGGPLWFGGLRRS